MTWRPSVLLFLWPPTGNGQSNVANAGTYSLALPGPDNSIALRRQPYPSMLF